MEKHGLLMLLVGVLLVTAHGVAAVPDKPADVHPEFVVDALRVADIFAPPIPGTKIDYLEEEVTGDPGETLAALAAECIQPVTCIGTNDFLIQGSRGNPGDG